MKRFILIGICLFGILISVSAQRNNNDVREQTLKFQRLIALIDAFYVDTVNLPKVTEDAIVKMLSDLDPHSVYISKEEMEDMNEPLEGGFYGIGIQFSILRDTLMVISVVPGGPSEKVGLLAGDRIVVVNGENIAGVKLSNSAVRKKLKGEKGTLVRIKVLRNGELLDFDIIRDKIPIHSVDAAYMLDKSVGYIKISRFSANTIEEFEEAVVKLKGEGMKDLILDLQGNSGGYLGAAIGISDNLLDDKKMIVYTDGLSSGKREEYATSNGLFENGRVVVLIDGNSASASEIVSGAVQDWDRGVIIGRRSFGKGLVQRQYPLTDGTMVRLTTAHYYTPSGRCIQKPYKDGNYRAELYERYSNGELLSADSIQINDTLRYYTKLRKRPVFGGGGIIPDVFVPIDTGINYSYFNRLIGKSVIGQYVNNYVDRNREELKKNYPDFKKFVKDYTVTDKMIREIVEEGVKAGVPEDEKLLTPVIAVMKLQLKALIAQNLWGINEMYILMNEDNKIMHEALEVLHDGRYEKVIKG